MVNIHKILKEAGISETASLVYEQLLETGSSSARQLAEKLNIPRPSIYDNLKILMRNDLVVEQKEENKKIFSIDDIKNLSHLFQSKIEQLKGYENELERFLPNIIRQVKSFEPKIKFYSGSDGIKQVLNNLLWYNNIETLAMWPISEMVPILGEEYLINLNRRRIRQKISIRGIWPRDKIVNFKNYPFLGVGKGHLRELHLAPKDMTWQMSYWLYADKVAFISSKRELFGFVVHSYDFTTLLKAQFEIIWEISKPIKPQPQYTNHFLQTI